MKDYFEILQTHPWLLGAEFDLKIITDCAEIAEWQIQKRLNLKKQESNSEWADIGVVLDDPFVVVLRDLVTFDDGFRNGYIRLYNRSYLEGGAAGVVILPEKDGKILLMHHFRHATRSRHWEFPRGFGEPGVSAVVQARVEIKEEIGAEIVELLDLGVYFANTGLEGNPINLFLGRIMADVVIDPNTGSDALQWVSVDELEKLIANAEITDGFTIAAYTRAKLRKLI